MKMSDLIKALKDDLSICRETLSNLQEAHSNEPDQLKSHEISLDITHLKAEMGEFLLALQNVFLNEFFTLARERNCMTKSYGGDFIKATGEKWDGFLALTTRQGKPLDCPCVTWTEK